MPCGRVERGPLFTGVPSGRGGDGLGEGALGPRGRVGYCALGPGDGLGRAPLEQPPRAMCAVCSCVGHFSFGI